MSGGSASTSNSPITKTLYEHASVEGARKWFAIFDDGARRWRWLIHASSFDAALNVMNWSLANPLNGVPVDEPLLNGLVSAEVSIDLG